MAITYLDERILIRKKNPFKVQKLKTQNVKPYVYIRDGMYALVLRPAYYYLAEFSLIYNGWYGFWSGEDFFKLEK